MAYTTVQVSGFCSCDPQWLKQELDRNGLQCVLTHTDPTLLMEKQEKAAQRLHDDGFYFMYHNHGFEFQKIQGRTILDQMREKMPAELMGFTLDTYWIQFGGGNPAEWIRRLSGRVPCIHLKDYAFPSEPRMAVIGEGNINFDRAFEEAEAVGTDYLLVEQDTCYGEDPFDCLARSYAYLKACGLE